MNEKSKIGPHEQQLRAMREAKAAKVILASKSAKVKAKAIGNKVVSLKASRRGK